LNEALTLKGAMTAVLTKADGTVETRYKDNIIVNAGFDFIADAIGKVSSRPGCMNHIAVGTGTTAAAATQTALVEEMTGGRLAATYAHTAGTKVFTLTANFNAGVATGAITEVGAFNAATGGTMFDRLTFAVINKGALDTLAVTLTFTMS